MATLRGACKVNNCGGDDGVVFSETDRGVSLVVGHKVGEKMGSIAFMLFDCPECGEQNKSDLGSDGRLLKIVLDITELKPIYVGQGREDLIDLTDPIGDDEAIGLVGALNNVSPEDIIRAD